MVRSLAISLLVALTPAFASAACPVAIDEGLLVQRIDGALDALVVLDIEAFRTRTDAVQGIVPCVDQALAPAQIADLHRLIGLRAFGERADFAPGAFAAARRLEPDYHFPKALIPPGNPVLDVYTSVSLDDRPTDRVRAPTEGYLMFDGERTVERPLTWPVVVQIYGDDGAVVDSAYLLPGEALPRYAGSSGFDPATLRIPLAIAAGASAVSAGVLYGLASASHGRYLDAEDPVPYADLAPLRSRTNNLVVASGISAAVSASATVSLALVW